MLFNKIYQKFFAFTIVVRDYINTVKTTLDFNFDLYQAIKQHGYTITLKHKSQEKLQIICKLVISEKVAMSYDKLYLIYLKTVKFLSRLFHL